MTDQKYLSYDGLQHLVEKIDKKYSVENIMLCSISPVKYSTNVYGSNTPYQETIGITQEYRKAKLLGFSEDFYVTYYVPVALGVLWGDLFHSTLTNSGVQGPEVGQVVVDSSHLMYICIEVPEDPDYRNHYNDDEWLQNAGGWTLKLLGNYLWYSDIIGIPFNSLNSSDFSVDSKGILSLSDSARSTSLTSEEIDELFS